MSEHDNETGERSNKPLETLRDGALKVSIFRNRGENGDSYAMSPGRVYTDKETNEVRVSSSLGGAESLRMAHLLTKAYERVGEYREQDKEKAKQGASLERGSEKNEPERER